MPAPADRSARFRAGLLGVPLWGMPGVAIIALEGAHYGIWWDPADPDLWLLEHWELPLYRPPSFLDRGSDQPGKQLVSIPARVRAALVERIRLTAQPERLMGLLEAGRLEIGTRGPTSDHFWTLGMSSGRFQRRSVDGREMSLTELSRSEVEEILQHKRFSKLVLRRPR